MDKLRGMATKPASSTLSPRWRDASCLVPVLKFNERCMDLFCAIASDANECPMFASNVGLWKELDADARRRLAGTPFVLVDIRFRDAEWWREVALTRGRKPEHSMSEQMLPASFAESLMYETLMFCWQMVGASRTVGMSAFAMSSAVIEIVAALAPHDVREIAERQYSAVKVRWSTDAGFWQDFLKSAIGADEERLAGIHLRAKLMVMGQLVRGPN